KVAQFAPYLLARAEAEERDAEDALLLDQRGHIVEASTANVFFVVDGVLITPPALDGPLPGITRAAVLEVAGSLGLRAREATVTLHDLERVETAFLTSSIVGLAGVRSIGWEEGGQRYLWQASAEDPLREQLSEGYERLVVAGTE